MILGILSSLVSPIALTLYLGILILLYLYLTKNYNYWKSRGVPGPTPHFPGGNMNESMLRRRCAHVIDDDFYWKHGGKRYCGLMEFIEPSLMVGDPELLKRILIKDFDHFVDRRSINSMKENEPELGLMLTELEGQQWKDTRSIISPTFTSGKMKSMLPLIVDCADNLILCIDKLIDSKDELEMKELFGRFATDAISSTAFGFEANCLKNEQCEFPKKVKELTDFTSSWQVAKFFLMLFFPKLAIAFGIKFFSANVVQFFSDIVTSTIKYRQKNNIRRNDFLQLMVDACAESEKETNDGESSSPRKHAITNDLIISNSILFFFAGFDTLSTALSFASYLLATNPDVQEKLVQEIEEVLEKHDGEITYEAIQNMAYLDMVLAESLRMFPPATRLERKATKDYQLPGTDLIIPKGMVIIIPVYSIHYDPDIYPDPEKFDPERFSHENKSSRDMITYQAFGQGPRNCVGIRFAQMEAKIALATVLRKFRFSPGHHTDIPLQFDPSSSFGSLRSKTGIQLKISRRTGLSS